MTPETLRALLATRSGVTVSEHVAAQLAEYLQLLLRWNARTNLSSIREPDEIVVRHFGESLQCAEAVPAGVATLLDYGSGAGFPGAILGLARPEIRVVLAESQGKKAAFLFEVCRTLNLQAEVHADRVEALPANLRFDAVTLRAVDRMERACMEARDRVTPGGWLAVLTTAASLRELAPQISGVAWRHGVPLAGTEQGVVALGRVLAHATSKA